MQDLRSIPDAPAPAYQDPLYLEDQVPRRRPPIGEWESDPELSAPRGMLLPCKLGLPQGLEEGLAWPQAFRLWKCPVLPPWPPSPLYRVPGRGAAGQRHRR